MKHGRNDPCPCGSGKKFKKCCESSTSKKNLQGRVLSSSSAGSSADGASKISRSFFQNVQQPKLNRSADSQGE